MADQWLKMGGPAFPCEAAETQHKGMSLRDYFAAKAMQGMVSHSDARHLNEDSISRAAYATADAMLKAREVQNG